VTQQFLKFLNKFSLEVSDNEYALQSISGNKFLPNRSIVLPGTQIFDIFLEGTRVHDVTADGKSVEKDLRTEWASLNIYFDAALLDIADITKDQQKTQLENWFDVLKKVMHMWESGGQGLLKQSNAKQTKTSFFAKDGPTNDADDFYVFIYDEEERQQ
jgi:hypothetical protein